MPDGSLFNRTKHSCPWDLESKNIIKSNHDSLIIIIFPKNQYKYSSDAFLSSFPQISMTPPALDAILSAESDSHFVTDLFTCVIVSLSLCDVICIALFSPNFQAVTVSDTTANTSKSPVPWTPRSRPLSSPWCLMSDDRWSVMASMCGLKHSNFCGWLRDVGPLMSSTAVCVLFASLTCAAHLKHTVSLMLHQAWMLLLNSRLNKMF